MKALLTFWFGREGKNYLRWRWRHNPLTIGLIPLEWLLVLLRRAVHSSEPAPVPAKLFTASTAETPRVFVLPPDEILMRAANVRELFSSQGRTIYQIADHICNGQMPLVTGITLPFDPPNWRPMLDDAEHLFCLNRWQFGVTLAKAWALTGNPAYIDRWMALWENWSAANPLDVRSPVWESYSVAERIVNWCTCVALLWHAPDFQTRILPSLRGALTQHAQWLAQHLETRLAHNHLINNARALYIFGVVWDVEAYRNLGWKILERELARQVLPDGLLGEQSTNYHLLLTRTYVEVSLLAHQIGQTLTPEFMARVRQMISVANALIRTDGSIPLVGDVTPDTDLATLVGMIGVGALRFAPASEHLLPLTENAVWYLTPAELRAWNVARPAPAESLQLPNAGYWIHRSPATHIVLQNDPRTEVIRHGHLDALCVSVWANGRELLADAGNSTYTVGAWQDYFRGASAHNTIVVDDLPAFVRGGMLRELLAREYTNASALLSTPTHVPPWWWIEASHTGYARLAEPVHVRRRVIIAPEYIWISDWLEGKGAHAFAATWHWGDHTIELTAPGEWNIVANRCTVAHALWLRDGAPTTPQWLREQTTPAIQGWCSPAYGVCKPANVAHYADHFTRTTRLDLIVGFVPATFAFHFALADERSAELRTSEWRDEFEFVVHSRTLRAARHPI